MRFEHKILSRLLLLNVLLFSPLLFAQSNVPTSQPSGKKYPRITCSEWDYEKGREGECTVETKVTEWELRYTREGKEKKNIIGAIKNLVVFLHPRGNNHRIHEYWSDMVGPGKPIDTNKNVLLALGTPGDNVPKKGAPILLTGEEMLTIQHAVLDYLYPHRSSYVLGGGSDGGRLAILWASKHGKEVKKMFVTGTHHLNQDIDRQITEVITDTLQKAEMEKGPFAFWKKEDKAAWWASIAKLYVDVAYTPEYFQNPQNMEAQGGKPQDFVSPEKFRELIESNWVGYFAEYLNPHWLGAQLRAIDQGLEGLSKSDLGLLPKDILYLAHPRDQFAIWPKAEKFIADLESMKKNVEVVKISDERGHLACCESPMDPAWKKKLSSFLN